MTTDINSQLKPIKLPEPNNSLSENEKVAYRLIIKEVKNELLKQGYNVQK